MCSKYNRLLLSTCIQVLAFGALTSLPAHAEFKWTPPDESEYVEDMGPDVFMVGSESSSLESGSALPEYYDTPRIEHNQAIEIHPPIEIKVLEENQARKKPVKIKTITLMGGKRGTGLSEPMLVENSLATEPASPSLILNPYPLEDGNTPPVEEESVDLLVPTPPADINWGKEATYEVIEGFGMEMPMALALSQIVPPEYAYSFSAGVNPGIRLSWEGGKAWNEVLSDALAPLGIEASIHGKKVVLRADGLHPMPRLAAAPKIQKNPVEIIKETPEQAMSASLKKEPMKAPAISDSVVLDKTSYATKEPRKDDDASTLVEDLMQPLDSFASNGNAAAEPKVNVVESIPSEEPAFRPEIILDEQEKAEEEYAKKLEESNPFGDPSEPVELLPISDMPAEEAPSAPMPIPFEEDIPMQASDVIDEDLIIPSIEEMDKLEPSSHFREVPSNKIRIWEAKENSNLQKVLIEWSAKERVPFAWNATEKYVLDYDVFISGTYQNAIDILFKKGLKRAPEYALSEAPYSISVQEEED